jgi:flavodoxin
MKQLKKLVIFYSLDGNTKLVAETIAGAIGAGLLQLKPKSEIKAHGFFKYFLGGMQVVLKKKPELLPFEKNPADYDLIFIGSPVWASSYTPAVNSFFSNCKLSGKKIAVFCTLSGQSDKPLINMKKALAGNDIVGENEFIEVVKNINAVKKNASKWANEVVNKCK